MPKFRELPSYQKAIVVGTLCTFAVAALAWAGLSIPRPAYAGEVQESEARVIKEINAVEKKMLGELHRIELDVNQNRLSRKQTQLRQVKVEMWRVEQAHQPVPPVLVEEKLELEDQVKVLETKVKDLEDKRKK